MQISTRWRKPKADWTYRCGIIRCGTGVLIGFSNCTLAGGASLARQGVNGRFRLSLETTSWLRRKFCKRHRSLLTNSKTCFAHSSTQLTKSRIQSQLQEIRRESRTSSLGTGRLLKIKLAADGIPRKMTNHSLSRIFFAVESRKLIMNNLTR